jgi:hypothetical protein
VTLRFEKPADCRWCGQWVGAVSTVAVVGVCCGRERMVVEWSCLLKVTAPG